MTTLPIACGIDGTVQSWDQRYAGLVLAGDSLSLLPLAYGADTAPNLILNGDFATDTVWTKGVGWTIAAGKAVRAVDPSSANLQQSFAFVPGATYRVTFTIDVIAAGGVAPRFLGGTPVNGTTRVAAGTYTQDMVAQSGNTDFTLIAIGGTGCTIDNVIVRRIQ